MIVFTSGKVQDTLKVSQLPSKVFSGKTGVAFSDKTAGKAAANISSGDTTGGSSADTNLVCRRYDPENLSFLDKSSFLHRLTVPGSDFSAVELSAGSKEIREENYRMLITRLKDGENVPPQSLNTDLALMVLLGAVLLLAAVRSTLKNYQPVTRFFLFRGINESSSADTGVLFHWQTTLLNLLSFFVISLYAWQVASIQGLVPPGWGGFLFWLACLGIIVTALTLRHAVCVVTGNLSGKTDVFNDYLVGVYQSYHFTAMILFILVVLSSFTLLLPGNVFIIAGICGISLMYLIRVTRLLLIFINRNISVFYLILYLCALEILPVAIIIRYFSAM